MATIRYVNTNSTAGGDGTTNATDGTNRAYASLAEWNTNEATSLSDDHIVYCSGGADNTAFSTTDFTTNGYTITIQGNPDASDGANLTGIFSTDFYYIENNNQTIRFSLLKATPIVFRNVQFYENQSTDNNHYIFELYLAGDDSFTMDGCIFKRNESHTNFKTGLFSLTNGTNDLYFLNNNFTKGRHYNDFIIAAGNSANCYILNNTFNVDTSGTINANTGLFIESSGTGSYTIKNNVFLNQLDSKSCFILPNATVDEDFNATTSSTGTTNGDSLIGSNSIHDISTTDGVDFVEPSTGNYTLTATSALRDAGTDLSAYLTTDITGQDRD